MTIASMNANTLNLTMMRARFFINSCLFFGALAGLSMDVRAAAPVLSCAAFSAPASHFAIGVLFRVGDRVALGLAPYGTGSHRRIADAATARYGPEATIVWGGELSLARDLSEGAPQIIGLNVTSGYVNALPGRRSLPAPQVRDLIGSLPALLQPNAFAHEFSEAHAHLFEPLNAYRSLLRPGESARHAIQGAMYSITGWLEEAIGGRASHAELREELLKPRRLRTLDLLERTLALDGYDCAALARAHALIAALSSRRLSTEELGEAHRATHDAYEFWLSGQSDRGPGGGRPSRIVLVDD